MLGLSFISLMTALTKSEAEILISHQQEIFQRATRTGGEELVRNKMTQRATLHKGTALLNS